MTGRKEKAAAILADHDGNENETQRSSKETKLMKTLPSVPAKSTKDWNGHTPTRYAVTDSAGQQLHDLNVIAQRLMDGDRHHLVRSIRRSEYFITAVK